MGILDGHEHLLLVQTDSHTHTHTASATSAEGCMFEYSNRKLFFAIFVLRLSQTLTLTLTIQS